MAPPRPAFLVLLVTVVAGCTGQPAATIDRTEEVEPGGFVELNLGMDEGAELAYRWSTDPATEVAFDVHSHPSEDEVRYHERANATERSGGFTAPANGTYSLLWENPADEPVTVAIHLEGDVELESVAP